MIQCRGRNPHEGESRLGEKYVSALGCWRWEFVEDVVKHYDDEQEAYRRWVQSLLPADVPCTHCSHPVTHEHRCYERELKSFGKQHSVWQIHRSFCPACERTFALLPMVVAPISGYLSCCRTSLLRCCPERLRMSKCWNN